ncbi:hypothetical protein SAMD00019534_082420, partial [Acytostelium subglobosum LB1]|uniref:hypothetical protein n=1 Tax=Acytostelium subglobosum LB1 TaxID=1410327 RepID=UPI0006448B6E
MLAYDDEDDDDDLWQSYHSAMDNLDRVVLIIDGCHWIEDVGHVDVLEGLANDLAINVKIQVHHLCSTFNPAQVHSHANNIVLSKDMSKLSLIKLELWKI